MEVVRPQPLPRQREEEVLERKKAREYEDIDHVSALNFDGVGGDDVLRLPRKANSVQCLMRMDNDEEDEDEDEDEDEEEEEEDEEEEDDDDGVDRDALWAKYLEQGLPTLFFGGLPACANYPPSGKICESAIIRSIHDIHNWPDDDDSEEQVLVPPPTIQRSGIYFKKAEGKNRGAFMRRDVELVLKEYNRQEGVDYEFVEAVTLLMTSPPESEPDPDRHGKHMNFFAKRRGSDSCPEFFFASLSSQGVHCCKLLNRDPTVHTIQHCEHTKCSECHLWTYRKKNRNRQTVLF